MSRHDDRKMYAFDRKSDRDWFVHLTTRYGAVTIGTARAGTRRYRAYIDTYVLIEEQITLLDALASRLDKYHDPASANEYIGKEYSSVDRK